MYLLLVIILVLLILLKLFFLCLLILLAPFLIYLFLASLSVIFECRLINDPRGPPINELFWLVNQLAFWATS